MLLNTASQLYSQAALANGLKERTHEQKTGDDDLHFKAEHNTRQKKVPLGEKMSKATIEESCTSGQKVANNLGGTAQQTVTLHIQMALLQTTNRPQLTKEKEGGNEGLKEEDFESNGEKTSKVRDIRTMSEMRAYSRKKKHKQR